jgi:hypothetical protein
VSPCLFCLVQLLSTDGIYVTGYDVGDDKLLLTLQRGWHANDVKGFLLSQPEVTSVEWDSVQYTPSAAPKRKRKTKASPKQQQKNGKISEL